LQAAYWQKLWGTLTSQAEEVRALWMKAAAAAAEPLKAHVASSEPAPHSRAAHSALSASRFRAPWNAKCCLCVCRAAS
jgi:hypothetical protein